MATQREHLGVGWAFPVRPVGGRLTWARYEQDVEQGIAIVLETSARERVLRPGFGAGLRDRVFDPQSPATHRLVEHEVRRALEQWEPRISLEAVRAHADEVLANVLLIEIDYVVRRTNTVFNLVYPFYLTEGV